MSRSHSGRFRKLRRYLLEGIAVAGPLGVTVFVLVWLFQRLDGLLGRYLATGGGPYVPGLGLLLLLVALVLTGWIAERALGARLLARWDEFLRRVPIARRLYSGSSRIVRAVVGEEKLAFREVVLLEYPTPGLWAMGFVTAPAASVLAERFGDPGVTVYMPTAPNPMSGYLVQLPRAKVTPLPISVEEAFTYVLSAGAVSLDEAREVLDRGPSRAAPV